jgi:hypothetical protein
MERRARIPAMARLPRFGRAEFRRFHGVRIPPENRWFKA